MTIPPPAPPTPPGPPTSPVGSPPPMGSPPPAGPGPRSGRSGLPLAGVLAGGAAVVLAIGATVAVVVVVALAALIAWGGDAEDGRVLVQARFGTSATPFPVGDVPGYRLGLADGRYQIATRTDAPSTTGRALGPLGATTTRLQVTTVVAGTTGDATVGVACVRTDTAGAVEDGFAIAVHGDQLTIERIGFAPATLATTKAAAVRAGSRLSLTCLPEGGQEGGDAGGAVRLEAELDGATLAARADTGYVVGFDAMGLDLRGRRVGDAATFSEAGAVAPG